jgi:hypothetical protein
MNKKLIVAAVLVLLIPTLVALASEQGYTLDWWTVDGGAGSSQGDGYSLEGTAGQFDAGAALSGGIYLLEGGFWAGAPPAPQPAFSLYTPLIVK